MKCALCNGNIMAQEMPSGGFLCSNSHLQCVECTRKANGFCAVCGLRSSFFQIKKTDPNKNPALQRYLKWYIEENSRENGQEEAGDANGEISLPNPRRLCPLCRGNDERPKSIKNNLHSPTEKAFEEETNLLSQSMHSRPGQRDVGVMTDMEPRTTNTCTAPENYVHQVPLGRCRSKADASTQTSPQRVGGDPTRDESDRKSSKTLEADNFGSQRPSCSSSVRTEVQHASRCFYIKPVTGAEVPPQFQFFVSEIGTRCSANAAPPLVADANNIKRNPVRCVRPFCKHGLIFVSDLIQHLVMCHPGLAGRSIAPGECQNFKIDIELAEYGSSNANMVFFVTGKITGLGHHKWHNLLPVVLMTRRLSARELCSLRTGKAMSNESVNMLNTEQADHIMFWVTGLVPETFQIPITVAIWTRLGKSSSRFNLAHSGYVWPIHNSQSVSAVYESGHMILLSASELSVMTDGGRKLLRMQLVVH